MNQGDYDEMIEKIYLKHGFHKGIVYRLEKCEKHPESVWMKRVGELLRIVINKIGFVELRNHVENSSDYTKILLPKPVRSESELDNLMKVFE